MKSTEAKIITLCGSSRFCQEMAVCAWLLEKHENVITMGLHLLPHWYPAAKGHQAEREGIAEQMDELHLKKIAISDEIFVVNKDDYIGESTAKELAYACSIGLKEKIRNYTEDYIGMQVETILKNMYIYKRNILT